MKTKYARAAFKRDEKCQEAVKKIEIDKKCEFDQDYWLNRSDESFHGEISGDGLFFHFKDSRLPDAIIMTEHMRVEK